MDKIESILVEEVNSDVWAPEQKSRLKEIKEMLKKEAKEIRTLRHDCKDTQRGIKEGKLVYQEDVASASWKWRHKHIAYCMIRGRSYEEIERKCHEGNEPSFQLVEKYKEEFLNAKD